MGRVKETLTQIKQDYLSFPLYILSHPFKGFDAMKFEKKGKISVTLVFLLLLCLLNILKISFSGFIVNYDNPYYINSTLTMATTIAPVVLFCVANWSVTVLMNGIGKFKEIFMVNMYAYFPTLFLTAIYILLSNVLTEKEMVLAAVFSTFGVVIYCFYTFLGLIVIHEFSFFKAIGSIVLTFLAMAIIIFVLMLLASLVGEVLTFFVTVIKELRLKFV